MITRTLRPKFSDKHKEYMALAKKSTISVAEGSVRAGKTVDNVAVFARMLDKGVPDKIHLATGSTSANAKMNIGDCNGFGLEHIFRGRCSWTKYKGNDALKIKPHNKEYIVVFAGGGKADSYKKIRGNSYGIWIATEINLHHEDTIKEAFNRQLAARRRLILWDLNPSSPASWIYKSYIDRFEDAYGDKYNYGHFTIRDNKTITEERIKEIEAQYDPNSIWYKRDILGVRCSPEGLVYDMFNPDMHVLKDLPDIDYSQLYVSSDYGIQNATVFLLWGKIRGTDSWCCIDEYYYSGREQRKQKTVEELVDGFEDMMSDRKESQSIIDPSASALIVEFRKRGHKVRQANNDVLNGIADVGTMLRQERLYIMAKCKHTIEEFGIYAWDEKASERGEDRPIKDNDHCMDAVRYFVKTMKFIKKNRHQEASEYNLFL